jgi:outer membrane receptor protein involved in Fe transport
MSDDFYFSNSHSQESHAHQLVDVKFGYKKKSFDISLWSKNIFNEFYAQRGFYFSNMPPAWLEERYTQRGAPRSYGVSVKYKF